MHNQQLICNFYCPFFVLKIHVFLSQAALCCAVFVHYKPWHTRLLASERSTLGGFEALTRGEYLLLSNNLGFTVKTWKKFCCRASRREWQCPQNWYRIKSWEGTQINLHVLDWISFVCSYTHVCERMHVIYPFPPWERHGVSVYEAVSACSLTAYKFPWSPFGITTTPLLNNLCFT